MPLQPLVSVVMPAYNHRQFVGEAIASVFAQSSAELELIVIDDGSTDGTDQVIAGFDDPRMRTERQPNRGSAHAMNRGISLARGEYVAIINSDDRYHPDRIAALVAEAHHRDLDFIVTDFRLIDGVGALINDPDHPWLQLVAPIRRRRREIGDLAGLLYGNYTISTSNFFFRRSLFDRVGPFRRYRYVQDWEYALRAALHAPERFGFLEQPLFDYRLHGANTILDAGVRCSSEIVRMYAQVLGKHRPEWREALARMRMFSLDLRRTLGGRARAFQTELAHAQATIREQQTAYERELAHAEATIREQQTRYEEELAARLRHIESLDKQLQTIYRSRSWRFTRPLRGAEHGARALRARLVPLLRTGWQRIPLAGPTRFRIKSLAFRYAAPLFRGTVAYEAWEEQARWSRGSSQALATQRLRYPPVPVVENLRIPGGVAGTPTVSVVIPVYNKLDYTLACLDSIAKHMPTVPIEVIVVDDCSNDDTSSVLSARTDIRYLRNPENLGFVGSCNRGAEEAFGEFVFFLNNDTIVLDGWLDHLVSTFSLVPDTGLVGSKLIYPDGRLQEAGGIIWQDGSGWNWGRFGDPAAPEYNFLRDVDYCSGAAILLRRELFRELGGFDERYAPAYYEDTDLAFAVRSHGLRVLYQPLSEVVHYEGVTSGTDETSGVKAFQARNRELFLAKWSEELTGRGGPQSGPLRLAADRRPRARILIIDACTPTPDQDSGSIDMINMMRMLIGLGYRITFIPESNRLHYGRYTNALQAMGVECLFHPYSDSVEAALTALGDELDAVMLVRGPSAFRYIEKVRAICPRAKVIFNTVDLHFLRERRRAELETGRPESPEAEEHRRMELHVIAHADTTVVISEVERDLLAVEAPEARVRVIPLLREIPGRSAGYLPRRGLVFVGGFRHPPNIDAMMWFCGEIWPQIRQRLPDVELSIVGSHLVPEVKALEGPGIRVLGYVEDIDPIFGSVRLSVAPLRYGAGQKGKVITSLSYGVPCVLTNVAAEGLGLAAEEGALLADDAEGFANAVVRLYEDPALWERLSVGGLAHVEREFSVEANRSRIAALLQELGLPA